MYPPLTTPAASAGPRALPRRAARPALLSTALLAAALAAAPASTANTANAAGADPLAAAVARLGTQTMVLRTVALSDLGVAAPIVLQARDSRRDLYLPVPAGLPISDASIQFNASYVLTEAAATKLVLSLDQHAVSARALGQARGDAGVELGVDGAARPGGFVQLGVQWSSVAPTARCADANAANNALHIRPDTRLRFRYDSAAIADLATAWAALPAAPLILTAGEALAAPSYDTAWRIGVALARSGRQPRVRALPQPGDAVDLAGAVVPAALRALPAFAALAHGGHHTLRGQAEIGALLALGADGPLHADIAVSDPALRARLQQALHALRDELDASPAAALAFRRWLDGGAAALRPAGPREIRLARFAGRPLIVLGAAAGGEAAGLFDAAWRRGAPAPARPGAAETADRGGAAALLPVAQLGGYVGSFDVAARAEWQVSFDIAGVARGRAPTEAVIDVAAAPLANRRTLTAAVLLNDILLGSQRLSADGRAQRIAVAIPHYAQLPKNTLRVVFQRPDMGDDCAARAAGAPVSVLPTSHIAFSREAAAFDFTGMMTRFSGQASLIVPPSYLRDASASLARVIAIADVVGVAPSQATMLLSDDGAARPDGPFLAFDLAVGAARERRQPDGAGLLLAAYGARAGARPGAEDGGAGAADAADRVGVLEVTRIGRQPGVLYRSVGARAPQFNKPFALAHGDLALLGQGGLLAEFDADGSAAAGLLAETAPPSWRGALWWMLPCALVTLFIALLVAASHVRRRKSRAVEGAA